MKQGNLLQHLASAAVVAVLIALAAGSSDSGRGTSPDTSGQPAAASSSSVAPAAPGEQWTYNQSEDPMAKGTTYTAAVQSTNTVNFDFPYSGEQRATLTLRTHPRHGKDVILRLERGQFLCNSYDGCNVLVRFDDGQSKTFSAAGPSDNSTETLFIRNYSQFVAGMLKAERVRISAEVYHEGSPVFEFDVQDFDVSRYKPAR
jgi:hypothetical protein